MESCCWSSFLAGAVTLPEGQHPMERTHTGAGEQHEEEVATETKSYDLTAMPIPQSPHGEELKWSGVKLHLTRRDEGGFHFILLLSYSIIVNK